MRSFGWVRNVVVGSLAAATVSSCGMLPVKIPVSAPNKDFIAEARASMDKLKGEYTLAKGLIALVSTKVDDFVYIEDGLKLGKMQWKDFRNELESCWNTPLETVEGAQAKLVEIKDLAAAYQGNSALHELQGVKDSGANAVNKVKQCPQAAQEDIKGLPKKATDEAKAFARGKLEILNELRVLAKEEVPNRAKAIAPAAQDAVTKNATQLASATAQLKGAEQLGDKAVVEATNGQITELNQLKSEAEKLVGQAGGDATAIGAQVTEATKKITDGFAAIAKRK